MTFPGITLVGSTPTFYKITVTKGLMIALATGQYPEKSTNVEKFLPPVDNSLAFYQSGMKHLNDRAVVFQCFQAFKQLMVCLLLFFFSVRRWLTTQSRSA